MKLWSIRSKRSCCATTWNNIRRNNNNNNGVTIAPAATAAAAVGTTRTTWSASSFVFAVTMMMILMMHRRSPCSGRTMMMMILPTAAAAFQPPPRIGRWTTGPLVVAGVVSFATTGTTAAVVSSSSSSASSRTRTRLLFATAASSSSSSSSVGSGGGGTTTPKSSDGPSPTMPSQTPPPFTQNKRICVVGGGLAGLSVTFHLLEKWSSRNHLHAGAAADGDDGADCRLSITVVDRAVVGKGGASAVAGGLIHPLSPRGKLVHWGLEGLAATNRLVVKACEAAATNTTTTTTTTTGAASGFARPNSGDGDTSNMNSCGGGGDAIRTIVLRDELYRIAAAPADATSDQQATVVQQLKQTAAALPEICEWLDADEITMRARGVSDDAGAAAAPSLLMGGLRLHSGCCVLHVPSYLSGLWKACQDQAAKSNGSCSVDWRIITTTDDDNESEGSLAQQQQHDEQFDVTIYCGGAGMFATAHGADGTTTTLQGLSDVLLHQHQQTAFPVQLVRGQSIELRVPVMVDNQQPQNAVLCGKYISPLPQSQQHDGDTDGTTAVVLVGATHEFQAEPLSRDQVVAELRERTRAISSFDWDDTDAVVVERVTSGYRVQSARGKYGRRPIIGRLSSDGDNNNNNAWIFSGLSSRGLLYHGLYGEMLADAILRDDDGVLLERCPDLLWWKK